jgi:hypothetical protein
MSIMKYDPPRRNLLKQTESVKDETPRKRRKHNDASVSTAKESKPAEEKDHTKAGEIQYWLMKAEPETRIVKGKVCPLQNVCLSQDVKFSIDDLQHMK